MVPTPVSASLRDLLADLLGAPVTVREGPDQTLEHPALAAVYRTDDGTPAAASIASITLAGRAGAAIGMMEPPGHDDDELEEELAEYFHEVVNVLAKLLNSPTTPHVALKETYSLPGEVASDAANLILSPGTRTDFTVAIEGYGEGQLTVVTAQD